MLRYKILHRTYYNFTSPVHLGQHLLYLRPREGHDLRINSSDLTILPVPTKVYWQRDVEDNSLAMVSFNSSARQLKIESEVIIAQYNRTPMDFLVGDMFINYPFTYDQVDQHILLPYMLVSPSNLGDALKSWCSDIWRSGEQIQTFALLMRLNERIHQQFSYLAREEPGVQSVETTLTNKTGSCRDFTWLFMESVRYLGFASRFVSGYLLNAPSNSDYGATHAWPEVYLPGAGWKGFDPTIGKMAGSDHIAVAVAQAPDSIPPVSGTFTGSADSSLDVGVWVSQLTNE